MTHCSRCGRRVRDPIWLHGRALGPVCAVKVGAVQPAKKRVVLFSRRRAEDDRQAELFEQKQRQENET